MPTIRYELTDTFGGEANYSWAKRGEFESCKSDLSVIRRVKKELGYSGIKSLVTRYAEYVSIQPIGYNVVIFINWFYPE